MCDVVVTAFIFTVFYEEIMVTICVKVFRLLFISVIKCVGTAWTFVSELFLAKSKSIASE